MKIAFLAIGNELLLGKTQEANGAWLAPYLRGFQQRLTRQLVVGDTMEEIHGALAYLYRDCDVVVCSGGLGPTLDDITKVALASFFGKELKPSPTAREYAAKTHARFGRELPPNHGYGFLPEGFKPLDNPSGLAPGLWCHDGQRRLIAAPGVPKEFRDMLTLHWERLLGPSREDVVLQLINFRTRGVPEEKIFNELCPGLWQKLETFGTVSSLPHPMGVDVGVTLSGSPQDVEKRADLVRSLVRGTPLAPHIWHEGLESIEEVIIQETLARQSTFAFAESCTGGLCSHRITNVSGASKVFFGAVIAYDNSVKIGQLGVKPETLSAHGAVSRETALEMARGARAHLKTTYALALTGIAGPGGGSVQKPVGTLWVAFSGPKGDEAWSYQLRGDREALKLRFSQAGLHGLLEGIRKN